MSYFQAFLGIVCFLGIAKLLSEDRRSLPWRLLGSGLALQVFLAFLFLKLPGSADLFLFLNKFVIAIETASKSGSSFMFGYLGGGKLPFVELEPGSSFVIAFQILPIIIVVSALSSVLHYYGIVQWLVRQLAAILNRVMKFSGVMSLGVAANVFLGIIEAPLFIRPYLAKMSRSELFTVLTAGMATIAGSTMVLYASVLNSVFPDSAGQLMIASLISAPAAIIMAQLMIPLETEAVADEGLSDERADGALDALIKGTMDGLQMVLAIAAVIVVLFACVSLINQFFGIFSANLSLEVIFGYLFAPFCWLMGIPATEILDAGKLMGTKTVLNEFVGYLKLAADKQLSSETKYVLMYAMCGFANFGSAGILVGGLGSILPERRKEVIQLSLKAMVAGTLATMMTGSLIRFFV